MSRKDLQDADSGMMGNYLADHEGFVVGYSSNRSPSNIRQQNSSSVRKHQCQSSTTFTARPTLSDQSSTGTATSSRRSSGSETSSLASSSADVSSSNSSIFSESSSVSTDPSIISTLGVLPIWHTGHDSSYDYILPCEFRDTFDCDIEFHPRNWQDWISHSRSHFVDVEPPPKSSCIFCDEGCVNPFLNWFHRMRHLGRHYMQHERPSHPDYFVIKHLYKSNLLEKSEYEWLMGYSERPYIDGIVSNGFKTDEMKRRECPQQAEKHDLSKERREMRKINRLRQAPPSI